MEIKNITVFSMSYLKEIRNQLFIILIPKNNQITRKKMKVVLVNVT